MTALFFLSGCYLSHEQMGAAETECGAADEPVCVVPSAGCDAWTVVEAECGADLAWRCPRGARGHAREESAECRPLQSSFERLGAIGPEVPAGGGCLMLANGEVSTLGRPFGHVGTPLPDALPFASCPEAEGPETPLLDRSFLPPDIVVDVMSTVTIDGETWSLVRLFVLDPDALFGVTALGSQWVTHARDGRFTPTPDLFWTDPVYRSAVVHEGFVYVFESSGEPGLIAPARLTRVPVERHLDPLAYEPTGAPELFDVGPHFAVTRHAATGLFVLTTIEGFGDRIRVQTAPEPTGPWSPLRIAARCELPPSDPEAFCDGARIFTSRLDPTRPRELVVGYRIGTLSPEDRRDPDRLAYWPPIVNVPLP
jgi:hypothetical protein